MAVLIRKGQKSPLTVKATATVEVELDVQGTWVPGCDATYMQPGEPDSIEDEEILKVFASIRTYDYRQHKSVATRHDLLAGVDPKSPDVQRLLSNLLEYAKAEVKDALFNEIEEDDQ
jgi:hypothetical protein